MTKILLNLSGHPLSKEATNKFEHDYTLIVSAAEYHIDFEKDINSQIKKLIESLNIIIDGSQSITVIPPGHSILAILTITYIHGLIGFFPRICYMDLNDDDIYVPKKEFTIKLQDIRKTARISRKI